MMKNRLIISLKTFLFLVILSGCHFQNKTKQVVICKQDLDALNYYISKLYKTAGVESDNRVLDSCLHYTNKLIKCDSMNKSYYNIKLRILISKRDYTGIVNEIDRLFLLFPKDNNQLLYFYKGIYFEKLGDTVAGKIEFNTADSLLKRITTAEGQAVPMGEKGFEYQYFLKDHLGSTRVVLSQNKHIQQQNSYYPFGMLMSGIPATPATDAYNPNRYLYNGKELQDDFSLNWYDYGARFYYAEIGRWHIPDPLSENAPS